MKHTYTRLCTIITLACVSSVQAQDLNDFFYQPNPNTSYQPDISFCIVDLKYDDEDPAKERLKVCEFGQGTK